MVSGTTNPLISRYNITTGYAGTGSIPPEFSTMTMQTNKTFSDDFIFNPLNDKFRYLRSNVVYPNTPTGVLDAIQLSTIASPIVTAGSTYGASFTVPSKTLGDVLYLIWDFRDAIPLDLCYSDTKVVDAKKIICCDCEECTTDCVSAVVTNLSSTGVASIVFGITTGGKCNSSPFTLDLDPSESIDICLIVGTDYEITKGSAIVILDECARCSSYVYYNPVGSGITATVDYKECGTGAGKFIDIASGESKIFCCQINTTPIVTVGDPLKLFITNECKCCDSNDCIRWKIESGTINSFIAWINCSGHETSQYFPTTTKEYEICARAGFSPNVLSGNPTIYPIDACQDKRKCKK